MLTSTSLAINKGTYCLITAETFGNAVLNNEIKSTKVTSSAMSVATRVNNVTLKGGVNEFIYKPQMKKCLISSYDFITDDYELQHSLKMIKQRMRDEVQKSDNAEELVIIDAIQRLGIEFYFQDEIDVVLENHYERLRTVEYDTSLHDLALRFRLLRQQGYNVSAEIFGKFVDKNGTFDLKLGKDTKGLMNLFEASHLGVPGEVVLENAFEFSRQCLQILIDVEEDAAGIMIRNILTCPYYKSLPRLTAKNNLHNFESSLKALHDIKTHSYTWIRDLQKVARIDIDMATSNYLAEISHVSRWWNKLQLSKELKEARSQPVKWHMWSTISFPSKDMRYHRIELTKAISFVHIIDDIFDVYGTIKELTLFTEAVNKWEYENVQGLPHYMKITLKALFYTTDEMSNIIHFKYGGRPNEYLKKAWVELCNAFLVEAKWLQSREIPTSEEYLENGIISTGAGVVSACIYLLLGEGKTWYNKDTVVHDYFPKIAVSAATILRLWDDLGTSKDEGQNGYDGSLVECFVNEIDGCSTENARDYVRTMIANSWKRLTEACLSPSTTYSTAYKSAILNAARMVPVMYNYDHNHRLPNLEKHINTWLVAHH